MNIQRETVRKYILAMALVLFFPGSGHAATEVGVTAAVNVDARAKLGDAPSRIITLGQNIIYNEQITTDETGLVQILLLDGTTFTIGPHSDLKIDEYVYDPDSGNAKIVSTITKGTFRFIGGQTSREPGGATVLTPVGTIGIRGAIVQGKVSSQSAIFSMVSGKEVLFTGSVGTRRLFRPGFTLDVRDGGNTVSVSPRTDVDAKTFFSDLAGDSEQSGGADHEDESLESMTAIVAAVNSESTSIDLATEGPRFEENLGSASDPNDVAGQVSRSMIIDESQPIDSDPGDQGANTVNVFQPGGTGAIVPIRRGPGNLIFSLFDNTYELPDMSGLSNTGELVEQPVETTLESRDLHSFDGLGLTDEGQLSRVTDSSSLAEIYGESENRFAPVSSSINRDFATETARLTQALYVTSIRKTGPDDLEITYMIDGQSRMVTLNRNDNCFEDPVGSGYLDCADDNGHHLWSWTSNSVLDLGDGFDYLEAQHLIVNTHQISYIFGVNPAELPAGSARYTGNFVASSFKATDPSRDQRQRYRGRLILTANFDLRTLDGYLDQIRGSTPGDSPLSGDLVDFPDTTWFSITDGRIHNGQFTAILTGRDGNPNASFDESVRDFVGRLAGRFFGPNAEEIGAAFSATRDVDGDDNDRVLHGVLTGKREEELEYSEKPHGLSVSDQSNTTTNGEDLTELLRSPSNSFAPISTTITRDGTSSPTQDFHVTSFRKSGPDDLEITYMTDGQSRSVFMNRDNDCFAVPVDGTFECDDGNGHYLWTWTSNNSPFESGGETDFFEIHNLNVPGGRIVYLFGATPDTLPAGKATYTGWARMDARPATDSSNSSRQRLWGRLLLSANFDLRMVQGLIDYVRGTQPGAPRSDRVYWDTSSFTLTDGRIRDGQFTALLTGRDSDPSTPLSESVRGFFGTVIGRFFGPNAEEVGALVSAVRDGEDADYNQVLYGFLAGSQDSEEPLTGTAFVGQNDFVVYFLNEDDSPIYIVSGTQNKPNWLNRAGGGRILTYQLSPDPIRGFTAPFHHSGLYGAPDNLAQTNLYLITNTHEDIARSLVSWMDISGTGENQKSGILVAPGTVLEEDKVHMINIRRGSFRSDADGPLAIMLGGSSTVPGSDQHFYGSEAENFILGPGMVPGTPEPYEDVVSDHCGYHPCSGPDGSYENDREFTTYHVATQIRRTPLSEFSRTSRNVSGFMAGNAEESDGGFSTPYILAAANSLPNFQLTLDAAENSVSGIADVSDVEDDSTIASLQLSVGAHGSSAGMNAFIDDLVYGATYTVGGDGTRLIPDNTQEIVSTHHVAGSYLVSGRAAPLDDYQHCTTCSFADWGWWGTQVAANVVSNGQPQTQTAYVHLGTWVAGDIANPDDLPSGPTSASFAGTSIANIVNNGSQYISTGDFSMAMDLSNRTGSLSINNLDGANYSANVVDASTRTQALFSGSLAGTNGYRGLTTGALVNDSTRISAGAIGQFHASQGLNKVVGTFMGARQQ